jgi:hypothetical protein
LHRNNPNRAGCDNFHTGIQFLEMPKVPYFFRAQPHQRNLILRGYLHKRPGGIPAEATTNTLPLSFGNLAQNERLTFLKGARRIPGTLFRPVAVKGDIQPGKTPGVFPSPAKVLTGLPEPSKTC